MLKLIDRLTIGLSHSFVQISGEAKEKERGMHNECLASYFYKAVGEIWAKAAELPIVNMSKNMEVIPAINCAIKDTGCVREKVRVAERFSEWIHLDVADGRFTFNKTWGEPKLWKNLKTKLKLEVHLMVESPEKHVGEWLEAGAKRLIVHAETINSETVEEIFTMAKAYGAEVMLAFSPETSPESAAAYSGKFSEFQILAVHPGLPAQNFLSLCLEKIKVLRAAHPKAKIEVDGGINEITGKMAKQAGADILISASYIFGALNIKEIYKKLKSV